METQPDSLQQLFDLEVVFDMASDFVIIGTLVAEDHRYFILEDADVHDLRESATTRERYVLETRQHGIRVNRKRTMVRRDQVVSISALEDVVD